MSLKAGIIGFPNVGKSTLFNAITKQNILAANYPFATIEPNQGIVTVPDERLKFLTEISNPEKTIPTTFEFIDIAGLVKGASLGEGLGNQFLANIREVDAICEVVRCFEDPNVIHVEGHVDPIRDIEIINIELMLADLEVITNRLNRISKKATMSKDKELLKEFEILNKIKEGLEKDVPVRNLNLNEEEQTLIKNFNLLTAKPIIYIANVSEKDMFEENKYVSLIREYANKEGAKVITLCATIEAELNELPEEEKEEFLKELGLEESGLNKLIKATYDLLGLATYFTIGKQEVRAWTFKKGMKASECAGIIHSDFEKGFIRAEVISYNDLKELGSEKAVKEAGKVRLEGKDYIMQDGDICHFRFNI
ncbi:MAG: redox-regulated ATPase YchF [Mollicutes bacterium]|nr:redox-regulated ATPase YchF [Mollicutes bacterium]